MGAQFQGGLLWGRGMLANVASQGRLGFDIGRISSQVAPLLRVVLVIVEFLAAVDQPGVAPAFSANGEFAEVVGTQGRVGPRGLGML